MEYVTYSHWYSEEMLPPDNKIRCEIQDIISSLTYEKLVQRHRYDNEMLLSEGKKTKVGLQFSLKNILREAFSVRDWIPNPTTSEDCKNPLLIDYYKNKVGATITFNNRVSIGSDLLCFQLAGEIENIIDLGIYICCTKAFSKKISITESTAMISFEKVTLDLETFKPIVTVPVWVIGLVG